MTKSVLAAGLFLFATLMVSAQLAITSIQNNQTELVVNDSIHLKKGSQVLIYLPVGKDFIFVKKKKTGLNTKLLGSIADVVGTSASMVGVNSGNLKTISDASKVINTANTVSYGANAIDQIQNLPISNESKKIAGKNMEIIDWAFTDDGYIIIALFEKKKYEIYLQEAVMAGEVKL